MDTVQIIFYDLKTDLTDTEFCVNLQDRLQRAGMQTHELSIKRAGDKLHIVTMGIFGTVVEDVITRCITRYLGNVYGPAEFSCASFRIVDP